MLEAKLLLGVHCIPTPYSLNFLGAVHILEPWLSYVIISHENLISSFPSLLSDVSKNIIFLKI